MVTFLYRMFSRLLLLHMILLLLHMIPLFQIGTLFSEYPFSLMPLLIPIYPHRGGMRRPPLPVKEFNTWFTPHDKNNIHELISLHDNLNFMGIRQTKCSDQSWTNIRELSFFTGRGAVCLWGGETRIFWGSQRGDQFFSVGQRGDQNFLGSQRGGGILVPPLAHWKNCFLLWPFWSGGGG